MIYTIKHMTSLWQANVRHEGSPEHHHEIVFYGWSEDAVRRAAERYIEERA